MEVTFLYEVGDIVMLRPMSGSDTDYTSPIKGYDGKVTCTQFRITQRRYVEEINGVGKIGYSGAVVGEIDKKVTLEESSIIKVDEYLTKKAIIDSTKPKKSAVLNTAQATQIINPAVVDQFRQLYGTPASITTNLTTGFSDLAGLHQAVEMEKLRNDFNLAKPTDDSTN